MREEATARRVCPLFAAQHTSIVFVNGIILIDHESLPRLRVCAAAVARVPSLGMPLMHQRESR